MPAVSFAGQQFGMAYFIIYHFTPRLKALDDSETWKKKVGPMWLFFPNRCHLHCCRLRFCRLRRCIALQTHGLSESLEAKHA